MARAAAAAAAAQTLFPPGAEVAGWDIGTAPAPWPLEAAAVAAAVPARQAEFAAGRAAARLALEALGLPPAAVPVAASRAPCWPRGITGSISHADGVALAVLAPALQCSGLGLDIEPDSPFPADLVGSVTRPEERRWLAMQSDPLGAARLIFAAKEAAYKCQFPQSQSVLGFDAILITADLPAGRLTARFMIDVPPFRSGSLLHGRFVRSAGLVLAGFTQPTRKVRVSGNA